MPPASYIKQKDGDFKSIVKMVLKLAPGVSGQRQALLGINSVIRAEFTREREMIEHFRGNVKRNLKTENEKQKAKVAKLKKKMNREGINFVEHEEDIGSKAGDTEI